jgi:hypothetical protein
MTKSERFKTDIFDIPQEYKVDSNQYVMYWEIETTERLAGIELESLSSKVSTDRTIIRLEQHNDRELKMVVSANADDLPYRSVDAAIRAILMIERSEVSIAAIAGMPRNDWRIHFIVTEHNGALEKDKTPLILAAERGDNPSVIAVIRNDPRMDIDAMCLSGGTALMYAALEGHMDCAIAYINKHGSEFTPLQAAVKGGVEMVKLFLANSADVNAQNIYEETPIWGAALAGEIDIVRLLLESGAKPDIEDYWGETVLMRLKSRTGDYPIPHLPKPEVYREIVQLLKLAAAKDNQ